MARNLRQGPPASASTLWAEWRRGLKDAQDFVLNAFQQQHVAHHEEPGSIANPTQMEVYEDKNNVQLDVGNGAWGRDAEAQPVIPHEVEPSAPLVEATREAANLEQSAQWFEMAAGAERESFQRMTPEQREISLDRWQGIAQATREACVERDEAPPMWSVMNREEMRARFTPERNRTMDRAVAQEIGRMPAEMREMAQRFAGQPIVEHERTSDPVAKQAIQAKWRGQEQTRERGIER